MAEFEKFNQFRWKVYIAGTYSGRNLEDAKDDNYQVIERNIQRARKSAIGLAELGYAWFCPHLNSYHFEKDCKLPHEYQSYLPVDFAFISGCDALLLLDNWESSWGTQREKEYAEHLGIPVFEVITDLDNHFKDLERRGIAPQQYQEFREIGEQLIRLHVHKNADYGANSILGCGELGLVTRLWDKICRLMRLVGFKFSITRSEMTTNFQSKNESIDDTLKDMSVYGIIGLILRRGKWGK